MAEYVRRRFRELRSERTPGEVDEVRRARYRHRNVVLHVGELRFWNRFANAPQGARLLAALRHDGIEKRAGIGRLEKNPFDPIAERSRIAAVRELGQHLPW